MTVAQQTTGSPPLRIFLSHAKADDAQARRMRDLLSLQPNLRLFTMDELSAGGDWATRLRRELSECDIFMVLLSPNSVASEWMSQELGAAWGLNKPIVPIVTHPHLFAKMPFALAGNRALNLSEFEEPEMLHQLLSRYESSAAPATDVSSGATAAP